MSLGVGGPTRPVRFPALSLAPQKSVINTLPVATNPVQVMKTDDFQPYRAGDYTVTTAVAGTVAAFPWNDGAVKQATSASNTDTIYLAQPYLTQLVMPGNQLWFDAKLALGASSSDVNAYCGLFDNVVPTAASNGLYFLKPAGGTTVNFIVKKAGVTTTFQNVADLGRPSGLTATADPFGSTGVLTATLAGGNYATIVVTTPGGGYAVAPLVIATGATGANAQLYCQLGATSLNTTSAFAGATLPSSTGIPYGSLVAPYITNPGNAAYTTTTIELDPIIDLQFYFDGKGRFIVGVCGRPVLSIGGTAVEVAQTAMVPGQTYNLNTSGVGPNFSTIGTQLTTSVAPFQPALGSFYNVAPQVLMEAVFGFANTTANIRTMYLMEYNVGAELN